MCTQGLPEPLEHTMMNSRWTWRVTMSSALIHMHENMKKLHEKLTKNTQNDDTMLTPHACVQQSVPHQLPRQCRRLFVVLRQHSRPENGDSDVISLNQRRIQHQNIIRQASPMNFSHLRRSFSLKSLLLSGSRSGAHSCTAAFHTKFFFE